MPPPRPVPLHTGDRSLTLVHPQHGATYHSRHGAVLESTHVFIRTGLEAVGKAHVRVLEVGLGTGLNLLLTWIRCLEGKHTVDYTALEPEPVEREELEALQHCAELAWPGLHEPFLALMATPEGEDHQAEGGLTFRWSRTRVEALEAEARFDVIYFDAFSPYTQPELWTTEVFQVLHRSLAPGGLLVTYCAKGAVRRAMLAAGFHVDRLPGPPGKKHMLRATKPHL
jgi:tRNA U34 5-methylaminomethyl-2-thiouridine-forming methyltransferase MnmC